MRHIIVFARPFIRLSSLVRCPVPCVVFPFVPRPLAYVVYVFQVVSGCVLVCFLPPLDSACILVRIATKYLDRRIIDIYPPLYVVHMPFPDIRSLALVFRPNTFRSVTILYLLHNSTLLSFRSYLFLIRYACLLLIYMPSGESGSGFLRADAYITVDVILEGVVVDELRLC